MKKSKVVPAIVAAAAATMLLLAGTFAWSRLGVRQVFSTSGSGAPVSVPVSGGILHDDNSEPVDNVRDKDIYIENYGETALIVRIQLAEYMEIGGVSLVDGKVKTTEKDWNVHTLSDTSKFAEYWDWELGGYGRYYKKATDADKAVANERGVDYHNPQDYNSSDLIPNADVITMNAWINEKNKGTGNYWVYDTDGWAYWANPLEPNTATGMLLNSIKLKKTPDKEYYYGIGIRAQMATKNKYGDSDNSDYTDFYDETDYDRYATTEAKELLKVIADKIPGTITPTPTPSVEPAGTITSTIAPVDGVITLPRRQSATLTAKFGDDENVEWSYPSITGVLPTKNGNKLTLSATVLAAIGSFDVKATSVANPAKEVSIVIKITE